VGENRTTWLLLGLFAVSERITEDNPEAMLAAFPLHRSSPSLERLIPAR
jgi:hypothetical protein